MAAPRTALPEKVNLRTAVLEILRKAEREVSLSELLNHLKEKGLEDEIEVKTSILWLISEGEIDLTAKRNLRIHREDQPGAQGQDQSQAKAVGAS